MKKLLRATNYFVWFLLRSSFIFLLLQLPLLLVISSLVFFLGMVDMCSMACSLHPLFNALYFLFCFSLYLIWMQTSGSKLVTSHCYRNEGTQMELFLCVAFFSTIRTSLPTTPPCHILSEWTTYHHIVLDYSRSIKNYSSYLCGIDICWSNNREL